LPASSCALDLPLRRIGSDDDLLALDAPDKFPRNPATFIPRGQALNEAARTTHDRDNSAAIAMDLVQSPKQLAVERLDLHIAQIREAHQIAPPLGIQPRTRFSTA
jgi:hypothetical protein